MRYSLLPSNGYVVYRDGATIVMLDTGYPFCSDRGIAGDTNAAANVGQPVGEIRGVPSISSCNVLIDMKAGELVIDRAPIPFSGVSVPCVIQHNRLSMKIRANGADRTFFFDTGAPNSYVDESWIPADILAAGPSRHVDDYHPVMGHFTSAVYNVPVEFAGCSYVTELCIQPLELRRHFPMPPGLGVLGGVLLNNFKILIDCPNGRLICSRYPE